MTADIFGGYIPVGWDENEDLQDEKERLIRAAQNCAEVTDGPCPIRGENACPYAGIRNKGCVAQLILDMADALEQTAGDCKG